MHNYKDEFIQFALDLGVLRFGEFTLKSGRVSPYFFNAGGFNSGRAIAKLGYFYAKTIQSHQPHYNVLFGPAYKGIPLVSATSIALFNEFNEDRDYCFNRKEAKTHGEGGSLVGASLSGKQVLLIDDVITAGTAIRESIDIIGANQAELKHVLIALDRQEKGQGELSAIQEIEQNYSIGVMSIVSMSDVIGFMETHGLHHDKIDAMKTYRERYGIQA
jgi:orotate phosphoribosyltransferase